MTKFYYKDILFSNTVSARDYSRDIDLLNSWTDEIRNEVAVKRLSAAESFSVVASADIDSNLQIVCEITKHCERYGIYDRSKTAFADVNSDTLRNIPYDVIKDLERTINRACAAILRNERESTCIMLSEDISQKWETRKLTIGTQDVDCICKTIEASLIQKVGDFIHTPQDLHNILESLDKRKEHSREQTNEDMDIEL